MHTLATRLLSTMASGTYTTRDLIRVSGHSPNTVVTYLRDLEDRGLVARAKARSPSRGRPATANTVTDRGLELLRSLELSAFTKLRKEAGVLWGPRMSLSFWGVPLFGRSDVFAARDISADPFDLVVERDREFYSRPVEEAGGTYPRLEPFVAWAATSDNPRYLAAIPVLLRRHRVDLVELRAFAERLRSTNRVGFLASVAGKSDVARALSPSRRPERMLSEATPSDETTARFAVLWNVRNPLSGALIKEMVALYGGAR